MNKNIRICILAVIAILLISVSVTAADAAQAVAPTGYIVNNDFSISLNRDGTARIHKYLGTSTEVDIPYDFFDEYVVTEIEEYAFADYTTMEELWLLDATYLSVIGEGAFLNCTGVEEVVFPDYVKQLGDYAFYGCSSLKRADLDKSLEEIPANCFQKCEALTYIEIPSSVSSIGDYAFSSCTSLNRIDISDSVTYISDTAFEGSNDIVIYCTTDSCAHVYAEEKGIKYVLTDLVRILGDADGNGKVNISDSTVLQRRIANYETDDPPFIELCRDINGDGKITVMDATYIQRYAAKLDVPYEIGKRIDYLNMV